jgi:hypothetical protein
MTPHQQLFLWVIAMTVSFISGITLGNDNSIQRTNRLSESKQRHDIDIQGRNPRALTDRDLADFFSLSETDMDSVVRNGNYTPRLEHSGKGRSPRRKVTKPKVTRQTVRILEGKKSK